jgi:hypothetical protein
VHARQQNVKERPTKKRNSTDDLHKEYDPERIRSGIRGKYVDRYRTGSRVISLAPDVAAVFPASQAVNDALRLLMRIAQTSVPNP